jgi:hypothetical protein
MTLQRDPRCPSCTRNRFPESRRRLATNQSHFGTGAGGRGSVAMNDGVPARNEPTVTMDGPGRLCGQLPVGAERTERGPGEMWQNVPECSVVGPLRVPSAQTHRSDGRAPGGRGPLAALALPWPPRRAPNEPTGVWGIGANLADAPLRRRTNPRSLSRRVQGDHDDGSGAAVERTCAEPTKRIHRRSRLESIRCDDYTKRTHRRSRIGGGVEGGAGGGRQRSRRGTSCGLKLSSVGESR